MGELEALKADREFEEVEKNTTIARKELNLEVKSSQAQKELNNKPSHPSFGMRPASNRDCFTFGEPPLFDFFSSKKAVISSNQEQKEAKQPRGTDILRGSKQKSTFKVE